MLYSSAYSVPQNNKGQDLLSLKEAFCYKDIKRQKVTLLRISTNKGNPFVGRITLALLMNYLDIESIPDLGYLERMGRKKNKKSGKKTDSTQVLFFCGVGMVSLIVGVILFGIIQSLLVPDVTIGKADVSKVIKSDQHDSYEIVVDVKNNEKKSVKVKLLTKIGFDVYRLRNATRVKPNFYRFFQVLNESTREVMLPPEADQKIQTTLEVSRDMYRKFELKPDTKIYPRITTEKVSWGVDAP